VFFLPRSRYFFNPWFHSWGPLYFAITHTFILPAFLPVFNHDYYNAEVSVLMANYLQEAGFIKIAAYSLFDKKIATDNHSEIFLYECSYAVALAFCFGT